MCEKVNNIKNKNIWDIFWHELFHHIPYGVFSIAIAIMMLCMIKVFYLSENSVINNNENMDILFHAFHFIHIIFSAAGAMLMFYKYSKNAVVGIIVGVFSAIIFCTLSDVLLPYIAGIVMGIKMELHLCFKSELKNIIPFLIAGVITGWTMVKAKEFDGSQQSLRVHFLHTFISATASIFYSVSHGLFDFYKYLGVFFILMVLAVIIPCTLSDVIFPIFLARRFNNEKS